MKTSAYRSNHLRTRQSAFSLIEVTLVIGLMLALASVVAYSVNSLSGWRRGREASEKLRSVYIAQKSYLADRPSKNIATFTPAELIPYLPGNPGVMPTQVGLSNENLSINLQVMPPVFRKGTATYDPSESATDGLWDIGPQ